VDESEFVDKARVPNPFNNEIPHSEPMITITGEQDPKALRKALMTFQRVLAAYWRHAIVFAGPRRRVLRLKRCKKAQSYRGPMLVLGPSWQKLILERSVEDILVC
jgi:hypothetical protein